MLRKALLSLLVPLALAAAPAAAADGPLFAMQGGSGVANAGGAFRYVVLGAGGNTALAAIHMSDGKVSSSRQLSGSWGLPTVGSAYDEGLSHDGRTLVLSRTAFGTSSDFLVVDTKTLSVRDHVVLAGSFSFDALSPDGSRLYLIQYLHQDLGRYVVRAYDLRSDRLLPKRIADRAQRSWEMQGYAVTRTVSADGRWIYTLYQNPGGYPFVHALDSVRGVAHCVGLPLTNQNRISRIVLTLRGSKLLVQTPAGKPSYAIDTATWRLSRPSASGRSPWLWAVAASAVLAAVAGAAFFLARADRVRLSAVSGTARSSAPSTP